MKTWKKALLLGLVATASAAAMAATPGTGLFNTHHDFASRAQFMPTQLDKAGVASPTPNSVGLCTYCHTPHQALSTALLWNHSMSANSFTWDEATTTGGTAYPSIGPTYKGPTAKCLSCHDGSVAIGDVALFSEDARNTGGPGVGSPMNTFKVGLTTGGADLIGAGGSMKGNHPVGMPYPLGQAVGTYNSVGTGADVVLTEFVANPHNPTATPGPGGTAAVKLFKQTSTGVAAGTQAGVTGVECSSCHDPHNKQTTEDLFLRGKMAGSTQAGGYICLQCHIK